jgi:hypothetical protein
MRKSICSKTELDTNFDSVTNPMDNIYFDGLGRDSNKVKEEMIHSPKKEGKMRKKVVFKDDFVEMVYIQSFKLIRNNYEENKSSGSCIVRFLNKILCVE